MAALHPRVLVIVGPTAVGKTVLALHLGQLFGGEVISADSRQIYRHMDIGTAKPTPQERALVPHHLIDVVDPDQELTLAHYRRLATEAIHEVWARGKLPMLVGGTGLYIRALTEGWTVPEVPPNPDLRARLEAEAARLGAEALHAALARVDPLAAQRIDPRNVRRVIRALEVYEATGRPISAQQRRSAPAWRLLFIGLTRPRPELYARIDARVEEMLARGLEREVRWLLAQGYGAHLPAMSGLGYRQMIQYLQGEVTLDEAVALIKRHTRRFVRQQYNWFRLDDPRIHWYDLSTGPLAQVESTVRGFLQDERARAHGEV
jgi:tRNA dimethylallyltransferase